MASAFLLTGCGASSVSPDTTAISLDPPGPATVVPCEPPIAAPGDLDGLTGREREAIWTADRINLANCGAQHYALIVWAQGVEAAFALH